MTDQHSAIDTGEPDPAMFTWKHAVTVPFDLFN